MWYQLNRDVTFTIKFYDCTNKEIEEETRTITYPIGTYVWDREQCFSIYDNFYSASYLLPIDALVKMAPDFVPSSYYNKEIDCDCFFYYWKHPNGLKRLILTTDRVIYN